MADEPHPLLARLLDGGPVRRRDLEREIDATLRPEDLVSGSDVVAALLEIHGHRIVSCIGGSGDEILAWRLDRAAPDREPG